MAVVVDAARYAAVNARVRGLLSRLLPPALWTELMEVPDLADLLRLLRTTWYADSLAGIQADPTWIERALRTHLAVASRAPLSLMQGIARDLLDWFWRRFEVDNLKTILRAVAYNVPPAQFATSLIPLGTASPLPWRELAEAGSVPEIVQRLHTTRYGLALEQALDRYRRERQLFVLEVALDLGYYQRLLRLLAALRGRDQREATRLLGTWVDAQNLLWAYRYRIYARFSPEEILNYTLHRGLRVDATVVQRSALGTPLLELVQELWGNRLPDLATLQDLTEREALLRLERIFQRYLFTLASQTLQAYPLHLGTVLAYEFLVDSEMRDLVALIEGKVAGWPGDRIRPYLIGARG